MQEHRIETTIKSNGTLTLEELPFKEGDIVEVIILERQVKPETENPYPLRGKLLKYDDPFGPAAPLEDWEALRDDRS